MRKFFTLMLLSLLIGWATTAFAQEKEVSGKVTDENGATLPGVSVLVRGTSMGTATDANGLYRLQVPNNEAVLVFSFIGYVAKEIPIGNQTTVNVNMNVDSKQLNEVVVTALGISREARSFLAGLRANMDKLQVAAADRDTYLSNPVVAVGANNITLDLIFKEKYVATYLNPEAWNDARRFNYQYKDFTLPVNAVLSTFIRRLEYPTTSERSRNGANVPTVASLSDRLWWDI